MPKRALIWLISCCARGVLKSWRCLEARDGYQRLETYFTRLRWRGESVAGKSLIIGFEAGHGDMIQFCRYAEVLKAMGAAHLALVCHPGLKNPVGRHDGAGSGLFL